MANFETKELPHNRDVVAPDGSDVRILLGLKGGGMAHFELGPGETSRAVTHRTVEEIWFFTAGLGEMWRELDGVPETVEVYPGVCLTIPLGTRFQFRCTGKNPIEAIAVTMPPWPGEGEAVLVEGPWQPNLGEDQEGGT
jgi:mannose-6-phosphate isomerase-like protein (cupin superfamily)